MSIEKCLDFTNGYNRKSDESNPTTRGDMYRFIGNQNNVLMNLASGLWQPSTAYAVGASVTSPSIPAGCIARCITAGTSSEAEPTWPAKGENVTDGTVKWLVENTVASDAKTERDTAIESMHSTIAKEIASALESLHTTITQEVKTSMLALFPVGTIIESLKDVNPGTYIGGTWEKMPAGYVTISAGTYSETQDGTAKTYTFDAGSTYGEAAHKLTVGELPKITGHWESSLFDSYQSYCTGVVTGGPGHANSTGSNDGRWGGYTISFGNDEYHANIQPSVGIYRFKRVS